MKCTHEGPCDVTETGRKRRIQQCRVQHALRARIYREKAKASPTDGWEDEFGPCPPRESDHTWYDQVAVENAMFGGLTRELTRLERAEYIRRTRAWSLEETALGIGASVERVKNLRTNRTA